MRKHRRNGLQGFLSAASDAGKLGFSATQSALLDFAKCSMCPFRTACNETRCVLLVTVEDPVKSKQQGAPFRRG